MRSLWLRQLFGFKLSLIRRQNVRRLYRPRIVRLEDRVTPSAPFPEFNDPNPAAGNQFGLTVLPLSTGNVVITSPKDDAGGTDAGAVYLFNGATGALISTLIGSHANDFNFLTVTPLSSGNYVVSFPAWDNGTVMDAGAATWSSGTTGVSGTISAANSLVGSTAGSGVTVVTVLSNGNYVVITAGAATWGSETTGVSGVVSAANSLVGNGQVEVVPLSNGNYVVVSPGWDNGAVVDIGAVTLGNGTTGSSGTVGVANSLVGSTADDNVGNGGVIALSTGNFLVSSYLWNNGAAIDAGAVTWASGTNGISGTVSAANSLVGSHTNDNIGYDDIANTGFHGGVTALDNGNYVVICHTWDNGGVVDAGAATWGSGIAGVKGAISSANSLVGSKADDNVGNGGVTALSNGNYVVGSYFWNNGAAFAAGAVTWGSGSSGVKGAINAGNSLVGSSVSDFVGEAGVTALKNGNYVVNSPSWSDGVLTGAVTWRSGTSGTGATLSAANSLIGGNPVLGPSIFVYELKNGNYVVRGSWTDNKGAVTWGSGTAGVSGAISSVNSLVGSTANDMVGFFGVTPLSNGNYVVTSPAWDDGTMGDVGAATWANGSTGISGTISAANSLVGSTPSDKIGSGVGVYELTELTNGNYVVFSPYWDNGSVVDAGAVTWGSGTTGISGVVSPANSLVGDTTGDQVGRTHDVYVGFYGIVSLDNGNYVVISALWDNGAVGNAGAVTWGNGASGTSGTISAANSLVGSTAEDRLGGYVQFENNSGVTVLTNGNYVVNSRSWDNGTGVDAGAATWASGTSGVIGTISAANSLVGNTSGDKIDRVLSLSNGNYLVLSPDWDNGAVVNPGAVTWGSGTTGITGTITNPNSMIGTTANTGVAVGMDDVNKTFFGAWASEVGGRVRVGSQVTGFAAPRLSSLIVNNNAAQRSRVTSLTITFDSIVSFTGPPSSALTLTRNGGGAVTFTATANIVGNVTVVTLNNFTGGEAEFGSLKDGRYTLTALSGQISGGGMALDGNNDGVPGGDYILVGTPANGLFRQFGDITGDGMVSIADFDYFRSAFGGYDPAFDFDNDGSVANIDFNKFRVNFGQSI